MSDNTSYNEQILQSIIDGEPYDDPNPYPSRIETLLLELKEVIESGGDPELAQRVSAIEAQLFSTIANVATNTDSGSMDLYSKDLNTIITSGFYNAITCTNAPADYCTLIVTGYYLTGYCTQIAMDVTTGKFYTRTQSNSTWGAWIEKANAADLAAKADASAVYTKTETDAALSAKQDALSAAQLSAVNSGITEVKRTGYDANYAVMPEVVDGGAKNLINIAGRSSVTGSGFTATFNNDGSVGVSWSNNSSILVMRIKGVPVSGKSGVVLSGCPSGGGLQTYRLDVRTGDDSQGTETVLKTDSGNGSDTFDMTGISTVTIGLRIASESGSITIKPMICTKTEWDVSHAYVPYCPSMAAMYEMIKALQQA